MKRRGFLAVLGAGLGAVAVTGCVWLKKNGPVAVQTLAKAIQYALEVLAIVNAAVPPALAAAKAPAKVVDTYNKAHAAFMLALKSLQDLDAAGKSLTDSNVIAALGQLEQAYSDMVSALAQAGVKLPGMTAVGVGAARGSVHQAPTVGGFRKGLRTP